MKNILLSVFALLVGISAANAQTVKVVLKPLQGTEDNCSFQTAIQASSDIKGFECILNIPSGMTLDASPFIPGPTLEDFDFNVKALSDKTYKFVVLSTSNSNATIPKDALLFTTQCSINPGCESQEYSISDLYAVMASTGQEIHASTASQPLKINNVLPTKITVSKAPDEYASRIEIGDEFDLSITTTPADASQAGLEWTSSDPSVATIDQSGHFTAISNGDVEIIAKIGTIAGTRKFTVNKNRIYVHWENQDTVGYVGESIPLEAYCTSRREYDDGFSVKYSITSGNEIARIENNTIYLLKAGDCIVLASPVVPAGENSYTINKSPSIAKVFTVLNVPAESISLGQSDIAIGIGQTYQLTANLLPTNATAPITWSTTDANVAKVDQNGVVTGVAEGRAQIIAKCSGVSATCEVTVKRIATESIALTPKTLDLIIGNVQKITVSYTPIDAGDRELTWTSSAPEIASVDADGTVHGLALGTATITATTNNGKSDNCQVTVLPILAEKILIIGMQKELTIGDQLQLSAKITPEDTTDPTVVWSVSDESKATITQEGLLTAISNGTNIYVRASCGETYTEAKFNIYKKTQTITWESSDTIYVGKQYELNAVSNAGIPIKYKIIGGTGGSNSAQIDGNILNVLKAGTITIKASNQGDSIYKAAELERTFTALYTEATALALNESAVKIPTGTQYKLHAIPTPEDATAPITWSTSDAAVATVVDGAVTGVKAGVATITATCSGVSASCVVTVYDVQPEKVELNTTEASILLGYTLQLEATVLPAEAVDKSVTWSSGDNTIATVDSTGLVKGVGLGETDIIATASNGIKAQCHVAVKPVPAEAIKFMNKPSSMIIGDSLAMVAVVLPENTTFPTITWTSSKPQKASINENGLIKALSSTEYVEITATCGEITNSFHFSVYRRPQTITWESSDTVFVGKPYELSAVSDANLPLKYKITGTTAGANSAQITGGLLYAYLPTTITVKAYNEGDSIYKPVELERTFTALYTEATALALSESAINLPTGSKFTLTAITTPEDATAPITWSSSDAAVATVADGVVTGVKAGVATVTATCSGISASCAVTVYDVQPDKVELNAYEVSILLGYDVQLEATVLPAEAVDKSVVWSSGDSTIATVDANGLVKAVGLGETDITATAANGVKALCRVAVKPVPAEDIKFENKPSSMVIGDTITVTAIVLPEDTTFPTITWTSSDPQAATVDGNGLVKALAKTDKVEISATCGEITRSFHFPIYKKPQQITWESSDTVYVGIQNELNAVSDANLPLKYKITATSGGANSAQVEGNVLSVFKPCSITVKAYNDGDSIYKSASLERTFTALYLDATALALSESAVSIPTGTQHKLVATPSPENATAPITWATSDPEIATVADGVVTGVKAGVATVTASCSGISASCEVTVYDILPEEVKLNTYATSVMLGYELKLEATVLPEEAVDKSLEWRSDDETIATVNAYGIVKGVGLGNTTISVTTANGVMAQCFVVVEPVPAADILFENRPSSMAIGDTITVVAIVLPDDTTFPSVTWRSSNPQVATVDDNGLIRALAKTDKVEITASCGDVSRSFTFPIYKKTQEITWDIDSILRLGNTYYCNAYSNSGLPLKYKITSGSNCAEIIEDGIIVPKAPGYFTVRIYNDGDGVWKSIEEFRDFLVASTAPTNLTLSSSHIEMEVGQDFQLQAFVNPDDCTSPITWETSDHTVAVVYNGLVHAFGEGTAVITAKCEDLTAECVVVVTDPNHLGQINNDFNPQISIDGNYAVVSGVPQDMEIAIFTPNGYMVYRGKDRRINLLHHNLYICRIQNITIKFTTK